MTLPLLPANGPRREAPDPPLGFLWTLAQDYTDAMAEVAAAETESEHVVALTRVVRVYLASKDTVRQLAGGVLSNREEGNDEH